MPPAISGHGEDDGPATGHEHLHDLVDPQRRRVLVWHPSQQLDALTGHPDVSSRDLSPRQKTAKRQKLARALDGRIELRAGAMGVLARESVLLEETDPLVGPSLVWRSVTPYRVQRHAKVGSAVEAVRLDVKTALAGYPPVTVTVTAARTVNGALEAGRVELRFARPVAGPLARGKTAHLGGGLFEAVD